MLVALTSRVIGPHVAGRLCPDSCAVVAEYNLPEDAEYTFAELVIVPGGPLFATATTPNSPSEVVALDSLTLEPRHAFGRALWPNGGARGMAVVGRELFVGDTHRRCLHVFSFRGDHLREVSGSWGVPRRLCFVHDRLYLIEWGTPDVCGADSNPSWPLPAVTCRYLPELEFQLAGSACRVRVYSIHAR